MSSAPNTTSSSNFEALFEAALAAYTKRTGKDLCNHPLAIAIDRCDSPDSVLAVFREQSRAFDEFRDGNPKLIEWLTPVVNRLHAISTSAAISASTNLVSHPRFVSNYPHTSTLIPRLSLPQSLFFPELVFSSLCV
jgi:hypothetical protein